MNPKTSLKSIIKPTPPSLVAQIAALPELSMEQIRQHWLSLFKSPPPSHNRFNLERRIAYALQANALHQSRPDWLKQNQQRITAVIEVEQIAANTNTKQVAVPGTVLIREYQGIEHRVVVRADGQFDFNGQIYSSLSVIARTITGTRWSGPLFFGLKDGDKSAKAAKKGGKL